MGAREQLEMGLLGQSMIRCLFYLSRLLENSAVFSFFSFLSKISFCEKSYVSFIEIVFDYDIQLLKKFVSEKEDIPIDEKAVLGPYIIVKIKNIHLLTITQSYLQYDKLANSTDPN